MAHVCVAILMVLYMCVCMCVYMMDDISQVSVYINTSVHLK
jgi:hypothetical protein